ncbi:MAG: UDP-N-acetylmuramate--L-alanine ligase [Deltaproteobacteria bacterium]|nr:UDP-N-acetylmuramate--L-alanine ligase [Deltaproteobacteria bacterium]
MEKTPNFHPLAREHNFIPSPLSRIYLMGICGTGMAALAGALKELGFEVTGSDRAAYPPMSTFLQQLGIRVRLGFDARNLQPPPDLVVVGNVITRENPEVAEIARLKIPFVSFPQALNHFAMKDKKRIVIAGTHGKTTTSSLVAWILEAAGLDPDFMIGGIPLNFEKGFKLGSGPYFVVEGDEYDTAFFDKGPKFFHYSPLILILTCIEFDHADIYDNLAQITANFERLVSMVPENGHIIANWDDPLVRDLARSAPCSVHYYGNDKNAQWRIEKASRNDRISSILVRTEAREKQPYSSPLYGKHNLSNLLAGVVAANILGLDQCSIEKATRSFKGVKRRQEQVGEVSGILVLDDFAHHPTAVRETTCAVKETFAQRRLVAVFEPRSNSSRRNVFQSFGAADLVIIPEPTMLERIPANQRFSSSRLVQDLTGQGKEAYYAQDTSALLNLLVQKTRSGDVVLFMSNGDLENLPRRFLNALKDPEA